MVVDYIFRNLVNPSILYRREHYSDLEHVVSFISQTTRDRQGKEIAHGFSVPIKPEKLNKMENLQKAVKTFSFVYVFRPVASLWFNACDWISRKRGTARNVVPVHGYTARTNELQAHALEIGKLKIK